MSIKVYNNFMEAKETRKYWKYLAIILLVGVTVLLAIYFSFYVFAPKYVINDFVVDYDVLTVLSVNVAILQALIGLIAFGLGLGSFITFKDMRSKMNHLEEKSQEKMDDLEKRHAELEEKHDILKRNVIDIQDPLRLQSINTEPVIDKKIERL